MYAIIETGGNQYRVEEGDTLEVDLLGAEDGADLAFDNVLMIGNGDEVSVGRPYLDGAVVRAKVLGETKGEKVTVFKYKPKNRYRVKTGHRQRYTRIKVSAIEA